MNLNKNEAIQTDPVFFDAARLKMSSGFDENGKFVMRHVLETHGVTVDDNGDVHITLYAPNGKEAYVCGLKGSTMTDEPRYMEKGDDGYFRLTIKDLPAGYHYHEYYVDGTYTINPQAPIGYGNHMLLNYFDKVEDDFYLLKDVPHGSVRLEHFYSSETGRTRAMMVYTPPGYDVNTDKTYPVMYLHHGGGECESGWVYQGKMNYIMDNLIAEGKCEEMLVVMNSLWCVNEEDPTDLPGRFGRMIVNDAVPYVEKNFRVKADPKYRAIAGLSMGSQLSFITGVTYLGFFGNIGVFSGGGLTRRFLTDDTYLKDFADPADWNSKVNTLFFGYGEQEEFICEGMPTIFAHLEKVGIPYHKFTRPGVHEWTVWRSCAKEFAQFLFKD